MSTVIGVMYTITTQQNCKKQYKLRENSFKHTVELHGHAVARGEEKVVFVKRLLRKSTEPLRPQLECRMDLKGIGGWDAATAYVK